MVDLHLLALQSGVTLDRGEPHRPYSYHCGYRSSVRVQEDRILGSFGDAAQDSGSVPRDTLGEVVQK